MKNEIVAKALKKWNKAQIEENFVEVYEALIESLNNELTFIVPVVKEKSKILDMQKNTVGEETFGVVTIEADNGDSLFPVFTSLEELEKGESIDYLERTVEDVFQLIAVGQEQFAALVIDPWGDSIILPPELIISFMSKTREFEHASITIEMGDITELAVDAIVNAANVTLLGGGGVDGAIHRAAGPGLLEECKKIGSIKTGEAVITGAYDLDAKYVIHTAGPIFDGSEQNEIDLYNCYKNSLMLAMENDIHSIAFPAISTGVYGYPIEDACMIALKAILDWIVENLSYDLDIILCNTNEEISAEYDRLLDEILEGDEEYEDEYEEDDDEIELDDIIQSTIKNIREHEEKNKDED